MDLSKYSELKSADGFKMTISKSGVSISSIVTEDIDTSQISLQREMLVREAKRINDQIQQIDNFLADCAKAVEG